MVPNSDTTDETAIKRLQEEHAAADQALVAIGTPSTPLEDAEAKRLKGIKCRAKTALHGLGAKTLKH